MSQMTEIASKKVAHSQRIIEDMLHKAGIEINGTRPYDITINHPDFFDRVLQQGSIGLGESYMDGWWDCERLDIFFTRVLSAKLDDQLPNNWHDTLRILAARIWNLQSKSRAWIVGKEHYDLGNDLFMHMLDPYMQYSCGYWKTATDLESAQRDKLELICQKLELKPGMRLLDIGCGWGGLSAYAAQHYGVCVTGVTISKEQQQFAQDRCQDLDVTILLEDYRDLNDQFDRIVSVGMFEHVGPKNYREYFNVVRRNIKEDGLFLLHTIGSKYNKINVDPWIEKYIFPNGILPSMQKIADASENQWVMEDWHNFGADYDRTLMAWFERFQAAWPELCDQYTPRFERMFRYYLLVCAGAFRSREIQLWQIMWSPNGVQGGLRTPR
ncbi:cyclopropane fatty acyl phospholipid synthase [Wohlfahrtiimonas chitiniclastica]|uniref:cyclopropane fatty acyl phospholipid synthase n=1 Tax=Wohlfahrtiimonas chitiniclastica TaxID=400946 RepID=UPI001BCFCB2A|nr:cyclopropane fatty acyl phospholipid synthase [Wohlfahrtiimonas chitiniclastica]MBS7815193.1 cyclopropane fatty acyl phospholipid synthase [Wohlfahrtiimonas chitiniclastica]